MSLKKMVGPQFYGQHVMAMKVLSVCLLNKVPVLHTWVKTKNKMNKLTIKVTSLIPSSNNQIRKNLESTLHYIGQVIKATIKSFGSFLKLECLLLM